MLTSLAPLLLGAGPASHQEASLDWLAGAWCTTPEPSAHTCERWSRMDHDMMLGTVQTVRGGRTIEWEFLRIEQGGDTMVYHASVKGRPAVAFRAVVLGPDAATFENPAHDYPQRIRYRREGAVLKAAVSKIDGSDEQRWEYRLAE